MAQIETWFAQDINNAVKVHYIDGNVFSQDNEGNVVGVRVFDGTDPVTLSGTISANVIRGDGATVAVSGTVSGNEASVVLPQAAYAVPGLISIIIKETDGTQVTTLCAAIGNVYESTTSTVVDPGTIIPSVQALIEDIETAVASIPADYSDLWETLAPAFSTSAAYSVGQYVTYDGGLYKFTSAHAAGSWSSGDVVAANIGNDLSNVLSAFEEINTYDIPSEYHRVEYLESSGTQSILAISQSQKMTQDSRVVIKFAQTEAGINVSNYLFGSRKSTSENGFYVQISATGTVMQGYGTNISTTGKITDAEIHTIDCDKNKIYLDDVLLNTAESVTFTTPANGRVFAIRGNNSSSMYYGYYKVYEYKEYANGTLVSHLIPCVRVSDGVLGMYDLVGSRFPVNEGSGTFTSGAKYAFQPVFEKIEGIQSDINGIEDDINGISEDIEEIQSELGQSGKEYIKTESDRVADKVRNVQTGDSITFVAVSDLHYSVTDDSSAGVTKADSQAAVQDMHYAILEIAKQTHIDFYACFGDIVYQWQGHGANYNNGVKEIIACTKLLNGAFGNNMQIRIVGNHDPNCENTDGKEFTAYQLNSFVGIYNDILERESQYGAYGFHDFERQKVRLIVLNTSYYAQGDDIDNGQTRYGFGYLQAYRLCKMLDLSDKDDASEWQIVICSHVALDSTSHHDVCKHTAVINAYETGGTWSGSTYSYNFSGKNSAKIAMYLNGHAHKYSVRNLQNVDSNGNVLGTFDIADFYIPNVLPGREEESFDGETYTKTADSAESTSFQMITVDFTNKVLYAHHYGAGIDIILHYAPQAVTGSTTLTTSLTSPAWSSNDTSVSTVSDGTVTPVADGNTIVWAKSTTDNCIEAWNISVDV